jgi:hypothetical protein
MFLAPFFKSACWRYVSLFGGSLFHSIGLCICFYANIVLLLLLWPGSMSWHHKLLCLRLCSFCSVLPWLLRVLCLKSN